MVVSYQGRHSQPYRLLRSRCFLPGIVSAWGPDKSATFPGRLRTAEAGDRLIQRGLHPRIAFVALDNFAFLEEARNLLDLLACVRRAQARHSEAVGKVPGHGRAFEPHLYARAGGARAHAVHNWI